MAREMIGGPDGALSTLIVDPNPIIGIDLHPSIQSHQERQKEAEIKWKALVEENSKRITNETVVIIQQYAALTEPLGERTIPPSWFRRKYIRWTYKLKEIIQIIKE